MGREDKSEIKWEMIWMDGWTDGIHDQRVLDGARNGKKGRSMDGWTDGWMGMIGIKNNQNREKTM